MDFLIYSFFFFYSVEAIFQLYLSPFVPSDGELADNKYKVVPNDHLFF